ncbi:dienelactone hydrolase family protein [Ideonella sp. 4Y11]|uniref:Dienelactone hydrolase family protein n=1 Tax=Ideonella aquatica TaxID=2824119 RepID=A0A941BED6_9BURK|nr:dienelactone hydrolase family protein [Ideonella aquatica]MBQ0957611.1 dienelactone hydrolase family protein [Ideonella aquatica]
MTLTRRQWLHAGLAGLTLPPLAACTTLSTPTPGLHAQSADVQVLVRARLRYWLYLPRAVATEPGRRWPVMFFLHGSGERGKDLQAVRVHGPLKTLERQDDFPFIVVGPQAEAGTAWNAHLLHALLQHLLPTLPADPDRVVCTGLSMGGFGTWAWAAEYPQDLAAIAPICGYGDEDRVDTLKTLPVWAFHGDADDAVPIGPHRALIAALRAAGAQPRFTEYPGVGHDSWTRAYDTPELLSWLLAQRRR